MKIMSTVVVGLNAALQKRLVLPEAAGHLVPGHVHRIAQVQMGVGGKGQDVALALSCLQHSDTRLLQFLGRGGAGDAVQAQLQQRGYPAQDCLTIRTAAPLRVCTSVVGAESTTELVEPSGAVTASEVQALCNGLDQVFGQQEDSTTCAALACMGSLPPDCPTNIYAQIFAKLNHPDMLTIVDSLVGLEALLDAAAAMNAPSKVVLKVNVDELCGLVKYKTDQTNNDDNDARVQGALQSFFAQFPQATTALHAVALTNGPRPAYVAMTADKSSSSYTLVKVPVPVLTDTTTLFPIGAGDAVAAGTLAAWQVLEQQQSSAFRNNNDDNPAWVPVVQERHAQMASSPLVTAFHFGLACGSASCLQQENSVLDIADVTALWQGTAAPMEMAPKV